MTEQSTAAMLMRPDEVAAALKVSRTKVYDLIARGELPRIRVGASVRVPREALEAWVRESTEGHR